MRKHVGIQTQRRQAHTNPIDGKILYYTALLMKQIDPRSIPGGGGGCTVRAQRGHSAHMIERNWEVLLPLAKFLPVQTIIRPHNVG